MALRPCRPLPLQAPIKIVCKQHLVDVLQVAPSHSICDKPERIDHGSKQIPLALSVAVVVRPSQIAELRQGEIEPVIEVIEATRACYEDLLGPGLLPGDASLLLLQLRQRNGVGEAHLDEAVGLIVEVKKASALALGLGGMHRPGQVDVRMD